MLLVTMALLGGVSAVAVLSLRSAAGLVEGSASQQAQSIGELVAVLSSERNSTGSYIWLFNYGWAGAPINSVYANGAPTGWTSCGVVASGALCTVVLPAGTSGTITIVLGGKSIAVDV